MTNKPFVPQYRKVYIDLRQKILDKVYASGERLPYERELCEQYGVKRVTIRKSLEMLAKEQLIEKRMGIGSFVAERAPSQVTTSAETDMNILFVMRKNENDIRHNTSSCNTKLYFAMEQICRQHGYLLSYVGLDGDGDLKKIVTEHPVSGIFLVSSYQDKAIEDMFEMRIPTVLLNHYDERLLSIMPDNHAMMRLVIDHLAQMGHKRIAYIDGMPESRNAKERWEGFRVAMFLNELYVDPQLYFVGNWTFEGGELAAQQLLKANPLPTAVFAASDMMAAGAMEVFRNQGFSLPKDISVIGYDDLDIDAMLTPPLSSATVDFQQMCEVAFEHLQIMMKTKERSNATYTIRMSAKLVSRGSVAAPRDIQC